MLWLTLLLPLTLRAATPAECSRALLALTAAEVPAEIFHRRLRADPAGTFAEVDARAAAARAAGELQFSFAEQRPVLERVIADLNARLAPGALLERSEFEADRERLIRVRAAAIEVHHRGLPNLELTAVMLDYAAAIDRLLRRADPALTGTYHRNFAERLIGDFLKPHAGTHLYFTKASAGDLTLWHIRPSAIYLQWLIEPPPFLFGAADYRGGPLVSTAAARRYLDGLWLTFDEIVKHDVGHSWYMKRQDEWLFETMGRPRVEQVARWTATKDRVVDEWAALSARDADLAVAARFLISEIVHERGYQFFAPILRQQFRAAKWLPMLAFKRRNDYWGKYGPTEAQFRRLPEARAWVLELVERSARNEARADVASLDARRTPVVLKRWHDLETHEGRPVAFDASNPRDIRVTFEVPGVGRRDASLYEIGLVMADVATPSLLTPERVPNLAELSKIETYKLERLLNLIDRGGTAAFTVTRRPDVFRGLVRGVDGDQLTFADDEGRTHGFHLAEVSLQPAPPAKVTLADKYVNLDADARFVPADTLRAAYERYQESLASDGPPFVTIRRDVRDPRTGVVAPVEFELAMVETGDPVIARAVSSLLSRSLEDARADRGGYLPPPIVRRVQTELVSPWAVHHRWGRMGRRFVMSRAVGPGVREIIGSALVGESRDNVFFFTSRFNNLKFSRLREMIDFDVAADDDSDHKWFDKFRFPEVERYKPAGYHHFANFVIEREGVRGLGLARLMIEEIQRNYARDYILRTGGRIVHSQRLLCGKGFWQIGDPPWLARMRSLGFFPRLGSETFHFDVPWAPLMPTLDQSGVAREHVAYNASFGLPQMYEDLLAGRASIDRDLYEAARAANLGLVEAPPGEHLLDRIPEVMALARSGRAKLQYVQLVYPF